MQGLGCFATQPMLAIIGVVASPSLKLLEKTGAIHGAKLSKKDRFGFPVQFRGECHDSEMMSIGLAAGIINWLECRMDFLRRRGFNKSNFCLVSLRFV